MTVPTKTKKAKRSIVPDDVSLFFEELLDDFDLGSMAGLAADLSNAKTMITTGYNEGPMINAETMIDETMITTGYNEGPMINAKTMITTGYNKGPMITTGYNEGLTSFQLVLTTTLLCTNVPHEQHCILSSLLTKEQLTAI
jgi:hypothetical protein